jgi:hypothetical protein
MSELLLLNKERGEDSVPPSVEPLRLVRGLRMLLIVPLDLFSSSSLRVPAVTPS